MRNSLIDSEKDFPVMRVGNEHLGIKLLSLAAFGVAVHLLWRWRRSRNRIPQGADHWQEHREPLLEPADAPGTPRQDEHETPPLHPPQGLGPFANELEEEEEVLVAASPVEPELPSIPLFSHFTAEDASPAASTSPMEGHLDVVLKHINTSSPPQASPLHKYAEVLPVGASAVPQPDVSSLDSAPTAAVFPAHTGALSSPGTSAGASPSRAGGISPFAEGPYIADLSGLDAGFAPQELSFMPWSEATGSSAAAVAGLSAAAALAASSEGGEEHTPQRPSAPQARIERSFTLHSTASDRRLPRVVEEEPLHSPHSDEGPIRPSLDIDVRLALKLDVIAGPKIRTSYVTAEDTTEVQIGRAPDNDLIIPDGEVSGKHAHVSWSSLQRCWQIVDLGSLNGTQLNGESIAGAGRVRGEQYRLCTDDIISLGTITKLKVSVFPREMLPENSIDRSLSLSLGAGSLPRSLTMPKHRIPSFSSLLTPKINSPSKQAVVAAASDELRLECCIASATGRDHARRGQACEDVALAECPLHGSDLALGPDSTAALFCVFDGHCGRGAADAASVSLPDEVSDRLRGPEGVQGLRSGAGAGSVLHDAFLATDKRINSEEGCTATAVLAWRGSDRAVLLQCANVGDSAAMLIDPESGAWRVLTEDHRLTNPAERDRLAKNGIPLNSDSKRLYGLNLARALGDKFLKDEDLGLSAEPAVSDVASVPLSDGALLVIASDGLWDVMDFERVAAAASCADKEQDGSVVEVAAAIVAAAKKAGTRDDVTALVVRLWPEQEWALRSPLMTLDDGRVATFEAP